MNEPVKLVPTKSDKELAEELKKELVNSCQPWLEACTKAKAAGFDVSANFGVDWYGRVVILNLSLMKQF